MATKPIVTTQDASGLSFDSAIGNGSVLFDGDATITDKGICWGVNLDPSLSDSHASGAFNSFDYLYYGGAYLTPDGSQTIEQVARYNTTGQLAALRTTYGSGRVFLSGLHMEVLSYSGYNSNDLNRVVLKRNIAYALGNYRTNLPVLIYNEPTEVWAPSVAGLESALWEMGIPYVERTAAQINASGGLIGSYRAAFAPGGLYVGSSLTTGAAYVVALVNDGAGFIGICSGAFAAATTAIWEGVSGAGIGIFSGTATGSIGAIAAWPGMALETGILTDFTANISGLSSGVGYYSRAYATNSEGTSYGENRWFKALGVLNPIPIFLKAGEANPSDIKLIDPTQVPGGGTNFSISVSDSAAASDALGIGVVLAIAESGQGSDSFGMGAALSLADAGSGADVVAQLLAQLAVNDSVAGSDALSQLLAQLAVNDSGSGADSLAGLAAALSISDTGTGADSPSISATFIITDSGTGSDSISVVQAILIAISDAAAANDSLSVSANISTADTGQGSDAIVLSVNLSVSDTASGTDSVSVLMDILKTVADIAQASDSVGPITVNLAVSDSGTGIDLLSALSVVAQIVDYASGLDVVIRIIGAATKTISITFVGKKPEIKFTSRQPEIQFAGKEAAISFVSNQPEIVFSGGRTAQIEFSSQGG